MHQWTIENDKIQFVKEVDYLGYPYEQIKNGKVATLPKDFDGWFPFMRMCYSLGDLAIVSGIFEALKTKYPKIQIAWPTNEYIEELLGDYLKSWNYSEDMTWKENVFTILHNNPHIDYFFEKGEFDTVFTDHERSYTGLVHDGVMIRSCDEPLAEQILRRFGFTDEDIKNIDSKPKVYFTQEEIDKCENLIEKYVGSHDYGCLLFSARVEKYRGRWKEDHLLYPHVEKYKNSKVFYYSQFDLKGTEWENIFPESYDFTKLGLSLREQIYLKQKAKFNVGYCGGVTEAASGHGSDMISLCAYPTVKENCVRGSTYVFFDGKSKVI